MVSIATNRVVEQEELEAFVRPRHQGVLLTTRRDGRPQASLVTMGLDVEGRIVVSSYPERAKVYNIRRSPQASMVVLSDDFGGEWVQADGTAEIVDLPDAVEPLVEYFRVISGEHSDWDEYREAMVSQGKCLIRLTIERWGPLAKGGFPSRLVDSAD
jgi:PPOX class probable F420-dependent enzyme